MRVHHLWKGRLKTARTFALACGAVAVGSASANAADEADRGHQLYNLQCAICHGENGDGQGKFAYLMNPRPRNFRAGKFKLSSTVNQVPTDEDLMNTLVRGMPGSAMPPWGHLSTADLQALIGRVREFHREEVRKELEAEAAKGERGKDEIDGELQGRTNPGEPLRVPAEPAFDNLAWFRGRKIYLQACAQCHGVDGEPVPEAVKFDAEGFPVPPRSFVNGIFKGGSKGHQLYARIFKGINGTPMPAYEGSYSDAELWDLIHYVQTLARAGAQERAELRREVIEAPRAAAAMPAGPDDPVWSEARPTYVTLTPLWWDERRIEGLMIRAIHDGKELAIQLSWLDPTEDALAVRTEDFRDAVAIQFALTSDPPFYMGSPGKHGGVNMWMWKADRQKNVDLGYHDVDAAYPAMVVDKYPEQDYRTPADKMGEEWPHGAIERHRKGFITAWGAGNLVASPDLKTSVEALSAKGPGTLSGEKPAFQFVKGEAIHKDGVWSVQMRRAITVPVSEGGSEQRAFKDGDFIPVAFAIWNGAAGDRDGKKSISIWQRLVIR